MAGTLFAVRVSMISPATVVGAKDAVTPLGSPDAAKLMLPANPFWPTSVMPTWPEAPWTMDNDVGSPLMVKLGGRAPVPPSAMLCVV